MSAGPCPAAQVLRFEGRRLLEPLSLCDVGLEGAQTNMVVVEVSCLQALPLLHIQVICVVVCLLNHKCMSS